MTVKCFSLKKHNGSVQPFLDCLNEIRALRFRNYLSVMFNLNSKGPRGAGAHLSLDLLVSYRTCG